MSYDPNEKPANLWHPCRTCGKEYGTRALAEGCHEAHARYGRQATTMFPEVPQIAPESRRKAEVFWTEDGRAICGLCTGKTKDVDCSRVEMLEPPTCDRCGKQIEPVAEVEIKNPNFLPPSERREIRRLDTTRREKVARFRLQLHTKVSKVRGHSIIGQLPEEETDLAVRGATLDERLVNTYGEYKHPKEYADERFPRFGRIEVVDHEPVEFIP